MLKEFEYTGSEAGRDCYSGIAENGKKYVTYIPSTALDTIDLQDVCKKQVYESLCYTAEEAQKSYYYAEPFMSDKEYDALAKEIAELEAEWGDEIGIAPNSPSVVIEPTVSNELKDVRHEFSAKSLDKTKDIEEYRKAFAKAVEDGAADMLWVTPKMDGITGVATYEDGKLVLLATRGNGEVGKDITDKAKYIKGLPAEIEYKGKLIVRGEMVMTYSEFERINQTFEEEDLLYKNPRNLASGTLNQPEIEAIKQREITFYAFALVYIDNEQYCSKSYDIGGMIAKSFGARLQCLEDLGFNVVKRWNATLFSLGYVVEAATKQLQKEDYPVDGLVTVMDDILAVKDLPDTGHHPNRAKGFAFKWADETAETVLRDIEWSASRTGLLNPVAVFDPVELCDTTVSRASLHNVSYIMDKYLHVGDRITVYKANMIIPQIDENLDADKYPSVTIDYASEYGPKTCPVCGGEVIFHLGNDNTVSAKCDNIACPAKRIGEIAHMCERDCLNIKGLSEEKISYLLNHGYIKNRYSLFIQARNYVEGYGILNEDGDDLEEQEGWGKQSVKNLADAINAARTTDFVSFLHAMGIANVGKGQAKALKKYLETNYENLVEEYYTQGDGSYNLIGLLTEMVFRGFDFTKIEGFGKVIADSLTGWIECWLIEPDVLLYDSGEEDLVDFEYIHLLKELKFTDVPVVKASNDAIAGKTFVITGSLEHYKNRDELVSVIERLGGKVAGSVSKNTNFLINNDAKSMSGKNKKAKELGIPIITEIEFMEVI